MKRNTLHSRAFCVPIVAIALDEVIHSDDISGNATSELSHLIVPGGPARVATQVNLVVKEAYLVMSASVARYNVPWTITITITMR
jgi:hypothetical protein